MERFLAVKSNDFFRQVTEHGTQSERGKTLRSGVCDTQVHEFLSLLPRLPAS